MTKDVASDVAIIGAGPSGAVAAGILCKKGYSVCVLERQTFPRFSIGESLLPQCMAFIEEAGMLDAIKDAEFQYKDGADFHFQGQNSSFEFVNKSTEGPANTFQVVRAVFDEILIKEAEKGGANVRFGTNVNGANFSAQGAVLDVSDEQGAYKIQAQFCLDASGYGRVLPRLLDLGMPSDFPNRASYFTHIQDNISDESYNRNRILITVHPDHKDVWFWLIPFSAGVSSVGVVGADSYFTKMKAQGVSNDEILKSYIKQVPYLDELLADAVFDKPVRMMEGYSSRVSSLHGTSFALLGNAGEFLDPVFSSGVTIAMKSASLAANLLDRQLQGESVCWETEFSQPLKIGVETFRAFVESWYDGKLIDIFFTNGAHNAAIKRHLTSILAGYAWDKENPYVQQPQKRLNALYEICQ